MMTKNDNSNKNDIKLIKDENYDVKYEPDKDIVMANNFSDRFIRMYLKVARTLGNENISCQSRKIGVVIVNQNNRIISTGYNGAAQGVSHTNTFDYMLHFYNDLIDDDQRLVCLEKFNVPDCTEFAMAACQSGQCPRKIIGAKSGELLELCPCSHAERNAIYSAAMQGTSTNGSAIFCYCGVPCHECAIGIIQSGIKDVICLRRDTDYSKSSRWLFAQAGVVLKIVDESWVDQ